MLGSIPVVAPPQLLLDLAECWSGPKLKWTFIEADRLGLLKPPDLARLLGPNRGFKGAAEVRRLARTRVPRLEKTRSLLEALFLGLCAEFGIPLPEVNSPEGQYIADFVWAELKLIVEVDGGGHRGHAKRIDDHRRENELVRDGWSVLRYDWWDLTEQADRVATEVIRARASRA